MNRHPISFPAIVSLLLAAALLTPLQTAGQEITGLQAAVTMEKVLVQAIARAEKSVVAIALFHEDSDAYEMRGRQLDRPPLDAVPDAFGTGVVIDRRGLILTNHHVVLRASLSKEQNAEYRTYVRVADKPIWLTCRIKAADPRSDLAVLEIVEPTSGTLGLKPITFGNAASLKKGQIAIALGNPYSIARDGEVSASWGIISNLRRKTAPRPAVDKPVAVHHFNTLIQTDAKLNLGSSGGALLNLKGEMIGLTTSLAAIKGYEKSAGYALAVDATFLRAVETLKKAARSNTGFSGFSLST